MNADEMNHSVGRCPVAHADVVSTRCPIVQDDAPEFMTDVPHTKVGDKLPDTVSSDIYNNEGEVTGRLDASVLAGRLTLLCVFDPECCICMRFALPRVQQLWAKNAANTHCNIVALGRNCNASALQSFRGLCQQSSERGDKHIMPLSLPMSPDENGVIFRSLAEALVPRFYLVGPDGCILYQRAGFEDAEFADMEICFDQELMYL
eukprot:TRINITY_DN56699_c0_g1_i1.p1 TRINITY_DN56699_c0_g1~~TRINITY_DN56699_c0_g1_i1.p1  ORF type:complete len:205 (+),score=35.74 TRINITY_DN56699_c0_g1_i1:116-730(+)